MVRVIYGVTNHVPNKGLRGRIYCSCCDGLIEDGEALQIKGNQEKDDLISAITYCFGKKIEGEFHLCKSCYANMIECFNVDYQDDLTGDILEYTEQEYEVLQREYEKANIL